MSALIWFVQKTVVAVASVTLIAGVAHAQNSSSIPSVAGLSEATVSRILNDYRRCLAENTDLARELKDPQEKELMLGFADEHCREIRDSQIRTATSKIKIAQAQSRVDTANERMSRLTAEIIANARKELGL